MYVYRMVVAAQTLPKAVLDRLAGSDLAPSHVHENKFFVGTGVDAPKRLSDDGRLAVIDIAQADLDAGRAISASTFVSEYCAPMKHGEAGVVSGALARRPGQGVSAVFVSLFFCGASRTGFFYPDGISPKF